MSIHVLSSQQYRKVAKSLTIHWGVHKTPQGTAVVGVQGSALCWLSVVAPSQKKEALSDFEKHWALATRVYAPKTTATVAKRLFSGKTISVKQQKLLLKGTPFQVQVWKELCCIPSGSTVSYGDVAAAIGRPKAVRAVGQAVGANPIGYIVPCHRVVASTGHLHGFRWGLKQKKRWLAREKR